MMNKQRHPIYLSIQDLIQQTLRQLREHAPTGPNPLASTLEAYRLCLQGLTHSQLSLVRHELVNRIMQEDDLSTRFVLKLMHDVTDAVRDGRRPAYLLEALVS
ncbi:MAG: hypothetical protein ACAI44_12760 [Candidatus Sericytochromatia bacterium]